MTNPNGTRFETALVKWFDKVLGAGHATRIPRTGRRDQGDVLVTDLGDIFVIEAKATKTIDLPGFIRQAQVEAANYEEAHRLAPGTVTPLVVVKRRNAGIGDAYVVMPLRQFFDVDDS